MQVLCVTYIHWFTTGLYVCTIIFKQGKCVVLLLITQQIQTYHISPDKKFYQVVTHHHYMSSFCKSSPKEHGISPIVKMRQYGTSIYTFVNLPNHITRSTCSSDKSFFVFIVYMNDAIIMLVRKR